MVRKLLPWLVLVASACFLDSSLDIEGDWRLEEIEGVDLPARGVTSGQLQIDGAGTYIASQTSTSGESTRSGTWEKTSKTTYRFSGGGGWNITANLSLGSAGCFQVNWSLGTHYCYRR